MKTFLKLVKNLLIYVGILILILVAFLYVYYGIRAHGMKKVESAIQKAGRQTVLPLPDTAAPAGPFLNLLPVPKKVTFLTGTCSLPSTLTFSVEPEFRDKVGIYMGGLTGIRPRYQPGAGFLSCVKDTSLSPEGYKLTISPRSIKLHYSAGNGLYYGMVSLKILMQNYDNAIPGVDIEDEPDLSVRGVMLDIGRNKIPKPETLLQIAQLLADLKYNHFELYIEGFAFAYPSFTSLWEGSETPLTTDDIRRLDAFCRDNYIDLVPNQNTFGHMAAWLATDEYKDLAECPDGFKLMGLINIKTTLDPSDPGSVELVSRMTDDLLPAFSSDFYNMNMDEPFELGKGKSKKICKEKGLGEVYLNYVLKMHEVVVSRDKKLLMWGDIALRHPAILPKLPNDVTLLDWGYESLYPFERNAPMLDSAGVSFMLCPGTSSWMSITGRTQNMIDNIEKSAVNAVTYGAKGMLVTDWGDLGHWQYLPVSYAGFTAGGALAWNSSSRKQLPLTQFLDSWVFRDKAGLMGATALGMGRYNQFEEFLLPNATTTMLAFQLGMRDKVMVDGIFDKIMGGLTGLMGESMPELVDTVTNRYSNRKEYDFAGLTAFLDKQESLLGKISLQSPDSAIVKAEYLNAVRLIRLGAELKEYIRVRNTLEVGEELARLEHMADLCTHYLVENKRLWLERNNSGGYETSVALLTGLENDISNRMELLNKPAPTRLWNRFTEKLAASATVIYLKLFT